MTDDEDQYDTFFMPQPTRHIVGVLLYLAIERLHALEEKFKSLEVHSTPGLDVGDMCLVPGLVIPRKFKVLILINTRGLVVLGLTLKLIIARWRPTSITINS